MISRTGCRCARGGWRNRPARRVPGWRAGGRRCTGILRSFRPRRRSCRCRRGSGTRPRNPMPSRRTRARHDDDRYTSPSSTCGSSVSGVNCRKGVAEAAAHSQPLAAVQGCGAPGGGRQLAVEGEHGNRQGPPGLGAGCGSRCRRVRRSGHGAGRRRDRGDSAVRLLPGRSADLPGRGPGGARTGTGRLHRAPGAVPSGASGAVA